MLITSIAVFSLFICPSNNKSPEEMSTKLTRLTYVRIHGGHMEVIFTHFKLWVGVATQPKVGEKNNSAL